MTDREKARDLGNQSAALARAIADVLNDTLDALEAAEAALAEAQRERDDRQRQISELVRTARSEQVRANNAEAERDALAEALLVVDDALVNGDAPDVAGWHRTHSEESAEDCLVCIVRAALARVSTQGSSRA